jgi:hypothetical protein
MHRKLTAAVGSSPAPTARREGTRRVRRPLDGGYPLGSVLDTRCQSSLVPSRASSLRSAPSVLLDRARKLATRQIPRPS